MVTHLKIKNSLKSPKDTHDPSTKEGVYKIECECGLCYIGQSGRKIKDRFKEHERHIHLNQPEKSAVAKLSLVIGHKIEWKNTTVLHNTSHYKKRIIQETIEIALHKQNFNKEDAYPLIQAWKTTLIGQNKGKRIKINFPNKSHSTDLEGKTDPEKPYTRKQDLGIPKGINPGRTRAYLPMSSKI